MKKIIYYIFISLLSGCLTVSENGKKILSKEILKSEKLTRASEMYTISYEFKDKTLFLSFDGGLVEEDVDKVLEKETVKKVYKVEYSEIYQKYTKLGYGRSGWALGFVIGSFFECIFTIPFRTWNPSFDEIYNREIVVNQRKLKDTDTNGLTLILRINDIEYVNSPMTSKATNVLLPSLYKAFGSTEEMEVLIYRGKDRVGFSVIPLKDAIERIMK
ncbi:hypothetical protein [Leptospira haakeii]|uniref:Lipoprotein n=1 Tax=Leptospira haakeii TaxID=2023198 RepID=A0ABX4PJB0_9LEPT|nr:hypothetical protein [Leptospira haakeii]PKA15869.1 hypothetical protein CH363_10140 [Leptospira haakeii]PKA19389.1 hypothetical protein CH377_12315 [Leptospira haakeii]